MSNDFELHAEVRTDLGKGASRRLRRLNDNIPAVIYGGGKEPVSLTIPHKDIVKATSNEAFFSHVITIHIGKKKEQAVIKDLQRHPAKPFILHADFLRINAKQAITVRVPLHFINEEKAIGVKIGGGQILRSLNDIEVSCLPKDLPEFLEVDMLEVDVGDIVHLSDLTLPKGVTSVALSHGEESDHAVATIQVQKGPAEDEESTEEAAAGGEDASEESED